MTININYYNGLNFVRAKHGTNKLKHLRYIYSLVTYIPTMRQFIRVHD